jgi:opacity protein-like surface antigen
MKKALFLVVLFIAVVFTAAAADPVVTVVNDTGYSIWFLYASKPEADDWGDDLLNGKTLKNGGSVKITLKPGTWDIQLESDDEEYYGKYGLKITKDTQVVFTEDDYED